MRTFAFAFGIVLSAVAAASPTNVASSFSSVVQTSDGVRSDTRRGSGTNLSHTDVALINLTNTASVTSSFGWVRGETYLLRYAMSTVQPDSGVSASEAVRTVTFDLLTPHFFKFDFSFTDTLSSAPIMYLKDGSNFYVYADDRTRFVKSGLLPAGSYELFLGASHTATGRIANTSSAVIFLDLNPAPVPEPGTMSLALGVAWFLRRRRTQVR